MSGLLAGKRIVVTGVLTDDSLAYAVADLAQREGRRRGADGGRPGPVAHPSGGPPPPDAARRARARRDRPRACRGGCRRASHPVGSGRRGPALHRLRPTGVPGGRVPRRRVGRRKVALEVSAYSLKVLGRRLPPPPAGRRRRIGGGSRLRRHRGLARLRLDGRRQSGTGVHRPLPGPRSRPRPHPRQPGRGRARQDHGGQVHPGLLPLRGGVGRPGSARLERHGPRTVARACVALLSDWFPATTGEMVHVDGGYHAMGV